MYELMALLAAVPNTGDDFQAGKYIIIGVIAAAVIAGVTVLSKLSGSKDDDDKE